MWMFPHEMDRLTKRAAHRISYQRPSWLWRNEHTFATLLRVEDHELERLRRSIAMLPPGHSAGALTRDRAFELVEEVLAARTETDRYRAAVAQLRQVLEALEGGTT